MSSPRVEFVRGGGRIVDSYGSLKRTLRGIGLEAHHLLEKRFAKALGLDPQKMVAVALDAAQHQIYTNRWRKAIGYGLDYSKYTWDDLIKIAGEMVYHDAPELLEILKMSK